MFTPSYLQPPPANSGSFQPLLLPATCSHPQSLPAISSKKYKKQNIPTKFHYSSAVHIPFTTPSAPTLYTNLLLTLRNPGGPISNIQMDLGGVKKKTEQRGGGDCIWDETQKPLTFPLCIIFVVRESHMVPQNWILIGRNKHRVLCQPLQRFFFLLKL